MKPEWNVKSHNAKQYLLSRSKASSPHGILHLDMFLLPSLLPAPVTPFFFLQQHPQFSAPCSYHILFHVSHVPCLPYPGCRWHFPCAWPAQHFRCPKQTISQWIHSSLFPGLSSPFHTQQSSCAPSMTNPKTQSCFQLPDPHRYQGKQGVNELHFLFKPKILEVDRSFH